MKNWTLKLAISLISFSVLLTLTRGATAADFAVDSCISVPELTQMFERTSSWTGGDAAYSIQIVQKKILWLFGDSFMGAIANGRREHFSLIHNSIALQNLSQKSQSINFYEGKSKNKFDNFFAADDSQTWLWPGASVMIDAKLYLFMQRIKKTALLNGDSRSMKNGPFAFSVIGSELLMVSNPQDHPQKWLIKRYIITPGERKLIYGTACIAENGYLYSFCASVQPSSKASLHPQLLARISFASLKYGKMSDWQYCKSPAGKLPSVWSTDMNDATEVMPEGATEMSVCHVPGLKGYFAVYSRPFLSNDIMVRHADAIDGNWSEGVRAYDCPKVSEKSFVYAAKAHPELSDTPRELIITYCQNSFDFNDHKSMPKLYVPQFVKLHLCTAK